MMKGCVLDDHGLQLSTSLPIPVPGPGEALIKVSVAGICSTDLHMMDGYKDGYRGVLGHEFVGVITKTMDDAVAVGQRVVGEINMPCNQCDVCKGDDPIRKRNHCPNRKCLGIVNHDGCLAEYIVLPAANLVPVPDHVPDHVAAFAEPVAAASRILEQPTLAHAPPDTQIAVLGDGKLGLLIAATLAQRFRVLLIGKHLEKLNLLDKITNLSVCLVDQLDPQQRFNFCVEATGAASGLELATNIVHPLGTIILKTTCSGQSTLANLSNTIVVNELVVVGSRCGNMHTGMQLLASGCIPVEKLVTATYGIDDAIAAFDHAKSRGALKVFVRMQTDTA